VKIEDKHVVGWREWVALPSLHIQAIKAKLDTGARTSALHAFNLKPLDVRGAQWVQFDVHPFQRNDATAIPCVAKVIDRRLVTNPGGRRESRYIVQATIRFGGEEWPIDLSLTNRDQMGFRLLIGRAAMTGRLIVDPIKSYRTGTPTQKRTKPGVLDAYRGRRLITEKAKK
jgi:hypothetical protein